MKKILTFLAMTASILMVSVSCNKNNGDEDDPDGPDEPEYVAPITIDGEFADWAKVIKAYADPVYVFVYFEWDKDQITHEPDVEHVPFHCYINTDGDASTGGYGDEFSDAATEIMFEGFIYPDGAKVGSYEPGVWEWTGDVNGTGWTWNDLGEFNGLCAGAGIEGKYEFQIARELMPKKLADNFSIGFDIQQGWESVGVLPNTHVTDDNPGGLAPSLQIKTKK